jgi:hypothetical protein
LPWDHLPTTACRDMHALRFPYDAACR